MPLITAHHVSSELGLHEIRPNVCCSWGHDRLLFGASAAGFATTLFMGDLPTTSPYPGNAAPGTLSHRYTMQFEPAAYFKFRMAITYCQVQFLLLSRNIPREVYLASVLSLSEPEVTDDAWRNFFPNGAPNDYSYLRAFDEQHVGNVFVNLFFYHAVPVDYQGLVERSDAAAAQLDAVGAIQPNAWLTGLVNAAVQHQTAAILQQQQQQQEQQQQQQQQNAAVDDLAAVFNLNVTI